MKVFAIIVTYNAMQWVNRCIPSVITSSIPVEIIVIDNGSIDGTQKFINENYPEVIFIQSNKNLGFGKANNIGIKYALEHKCDYVYLLNQDAWVMPNTIEKLIEMHEKNTQFGILSPFQLQANMQHIDLNFVSLVCSWSFNKNLLEDLYFEQRRDIYSVPMVMAAHWLISKGCLQKVGGFSPIFPHYGEDNNYADRALYHGFKIGIVPSAIAIHDRENRERNKKKELYLYYISCLIFLNDIGNSRKEIIIKVFYTLCKVMFTYNFLAMFRYLLRILFNIPQIKKSRRISLGYCSFLNVDGK